MLKRKYFLKGADLINTLQAFHSLHAEKIIQNFKKRGFEGFYCETKEEATKKALEIMTEGSLVSWGGSMTLEEIGLIDKVRHGNYNVLDRATTTNREELEEMYFEALRADFYLMSSNAVSFDGKLINIDGFGNRIAALIHGPKNIIVIAGMNKVVANEESAIIRAKTHASPLNAIRLNKNTPCASTGLCHKCHCDDCICANVLVTRMSRNKGRIKVILVGENLGY